MSTALLAVFLAEAMLCAVSGEHLYRKVGKDLVLTPDKSSVPDSITTILWKHGKNKVAEWDKDFGGLDIYAAFINRTTLDQTTGELRISGLMKTDSGDYSVEFNGKPLKTFTLSVIKAVPKPAITSSCNSNKTSCTLTCEGNTTDAEPVTYSWKAGEGAWEVSGQQKIVSRNDNTNSYTCQLTNPVSEASEDFDKDLFGPDGWLTKARLFGISVFVLAVAGVLLFILGHRAKTGVCFYEKESMPWEGEFWKDQGEVRPATDASNGVSASTGVSYSAVNTPTAEEGRGKEEEALARNNDHQDDKVW
ncbi:CD48 antigen [Salmo salar]|uniref:CD48 antigen n=1 Tax=Salmo salar TaxID=8030 RepID=A0A1S3MTW7_SALSA|nr:CD48 antigen-like [Salmo salar]|eukprot:XP_014006216.1 PREDICTED: CD48 antigen-like [Salmo salar]